MPNVLVTGATGFIGNHVIMANNATLGGHVEVGDYVVFHDAGAYGSSMASNYNTRGLAPEVLIEDGEPRLIRRRQTIDDLLALEEQI